eukprot:TRINITY_DN6787_c0_g1_i1.p1 TRINITY_DN6787_c0_g1~~TRINITY_DN6787_c0_g1_i1.p1  ORF type:complete len:698 (+),score=104.30 TRINITY_DN6787_c0_g1_i1:121-2094(+)
MGPLKEAFITSVVSHLQHRHEGQTLLTALNHPSYGSTDIRAAWADLKSNGKDEGVKKATGLQAILQERPDLFTLFTTDRGHLSVVLTKSAQALDMSAGLPARIEGDLDADVGLGGDLHGAFSEDVPDIDAGLSFGYEDGVASAAGGGNAVSDAAPVQERRSKVARTGKAKGGAKGGTSTTPAWSPVHGYMDIVWTPEMAIKKALEKQKMDMLVRSLHRAIDMHNGGAVSLSQLGSDFKVAELKKDPFFKNWRLLDILKDFGDIFELEAVPNISGGILVRLQPGAAAALPDAEAAAEHVDESEALLPERVENPRTLREKIQSLRIELLHALHRRGGKTAIQDLGQEPRVQKRKQGLHQAKKLIDTVRIFPENFEVSQADDGQFVVEIKNFDVSDQSMIEQSLRGPDAAPQASKSNGGRGRTQPVASEPRRDGGDRTERDRGRDRASSGHTSSSSRTHGRQAYGSHGPLAHPAYGYPGQPPPGYPGYPAPGAYPVHHPPHPAVAHAGYPPPHSSGYGPPPAYGHPGYGAPAPAGYHAPPAHGHPHGGPPPALPAPAAHHPPPHYPQAAHPGHPGAPPPQQAAPPGYGPPPAGAHPPAGHHPGAPPASHHPGAPPAGHHPGAPPAGHHPGYGHHAPPAHPHPYAHAPPPQPHPHYPPPRP